MINTIKSDVLGESERSWFWRQFSIYSNFIISAVLPGRECKQSEPSVKTNFFLILPVWGLINNILKSNWQGQISTKIIDNSQPILSSCWHHEEQLWSKLFFPLEKVKILIFSQNWSSEGGWGHPHPPSPKGKIFLCISGRIRPFLA